MYVFLRQPNDKGLKQFMKLEEMKIQLENNGENWKSKRDRKRQKEVKNGKKKIY